MSAEERKQILQMVEDGKITADQALVLIRELEQDSLEEAGVLPEGTEPAASGVAIGGPVSASAPQWEHTAARVRSLWQIPLWIGVGMTVLSALAIYSVMQSAGYNFWFYCLWLPFMLGVALMALAAWSRTARWLFVNVERAAASDGPRRIFLGFPLPLDLAGWFLRTFGSYIGGLRHTNVDEVVQAISLAKTIDEPLIVNVDDGDDGERVQVYIG
ncbi:MAG: SHOCT-like domain-containing protein [Bacteroidota bacterium]